MSSNSSTFKNPSPREWEETYDIPTLQLRAKEILAKCNPKPVIAFDLDYTLWPANCFEHTAPPYKASLRQHEMSRPGDEDHSTTVRDHIYCVCRKTNNFRSFSMYPQTKSILEFLVDHEIVMTICSRSPDRNVVRQILSEFGMWDWLLYPQVYASRKTFHFRNLNEATGLQMKDFVFYDDEMANVAMCQKIGVHACLVDKRTGINWATFVKGLHGFYNKQRNSISLQHWLVTNTQKQDSSNTLTTCEDSEEDCGEMSPMEGAPLSNSSLSSSMSPPSSPGKMHNNAMSSSMKRFVKPSLVIDLS